MSTTQSIGRLRLALGMALALGTALAAQGGADGPPAAAPAASRPLKATPAPPNYVVVPDPASGSRQRGGLEATRALVARLGAGRGEAAVTMTRSDPMGGPAMVVQGRLALEPPDRVRLDFPSTGERIAVRREGGEWIQPAARQMVKLKPEQAEMAASLWEMFLRGGDDIYSERRLGRGRFVLEARAKDEGLPGPIHLTLDGRGLPAVLEMADAPGDSVRYAFKGWRFIRAAGAPAFVLRPPPGYAVVDLP